MYNHEFCYWLQGHFELREDSNALTKDQCECIQKHINLVKEVEGDNTGPFITWLEGTLSVIDTTEFVEDKEVVGVILASTTELVRGKLNECFEHVIDKKYSDDPKVQVNLNNIHDAMKPSRPPRPPFDHNTPMRC